MYKFMVLLLVIAPRCGSDDPSTSPVPVDTGQPTTFSNATTTHLPSSDLEGLSMDAAIADIDADGDLDIVIANEHRPNIILMNDGTGKFTNESSQRIPQVDHDSEDVGIADFDADGDLDIVIVSEDDKINELYLNDGKGFFEDAGNRLPVTGTSNSGMVADINEDGFPDIIIGNNGQNRILINDGSANFTDESIARMGAAEDVTQDIELGDVDGDGDLDMLIGNEDRNRLLINRGGGFFDDESSARLVFRTEDEETREADFGDVDGDGDLDILFANVEAFVQGALRQNRLLLNDGQGKFTDATSQLPMDEDRSLDGDFIDLDGDGDLDIITSNINGDGFGGATPYRVYINDGTGNFSDQTSQILPPNALGRGLDAEFEDFNSDGKKDLFLCSRGSVDLLLLQQ